MCAIRWRSGFPSVRGTEGKSDVHEAAAVNRRPDHVGKLRLLFRRPQDILHISSAIKSSPRTVMDRGPFPLAYFSGMGQSKAPLPAGLSSVQGPPTYTPFSK